MQIKLNHYKITDRYVIGRIIGDYPANRKELTRVIRLEKTGDEFIDDCNERRKLRIEAELRAVEKALEWTERQPNAEVYLEIIKMVYFKKTHAPYGAVMATEISRREFDKFISSFRAIVAGSVGRLEPM